MPFKSLPFGVFLIVLIALLFALQYMGHWHTALYFEAALIWQEPWRILSGHLTHLNWPHAFLNFAGLAFVGLLFKRHFSARSFTNAVITIAVVTSLLVWLIGQPDAFVGLSAIIHGLLLFSLLHEARPAHRSQTHENKPAAQARKSIDILTWIIIVAVIAKVAAEAFGITLTAGLIPAAAAGINQQVWILHGAGLVGGLLAWLLDKRSIRELAKAETKND